MRKTSFITSKKPLKPDQVLNLVNEAKSDPIPENLVKSRKKPAHFMIHFSGDRIHKRKSNGEKQIGYQLKELMRDPKRIIKTVKSTVFTGPGYYNPKDNLLYRNPTKSGLISKLDRTKNTIDQELGEIRKNTKTCPGSYNIPSKIGTNNSIMYYKPELSNNNMRPNNNMKPNLTTIQESQLRIRRSRSEVVPCRHSSFWSSTNVKIPDKKENSSPMEDKPVFYNPATKIHIEK